MQLALTTALLVIAVAFGCQYVDSTLGMGFGTTLTPLLLLFGFAPMQIVPAILLAELVSGLFAGVLHHYHGNVDFGLELQHLRGFRATRSWQRRLMHLRRTVPLHLKIVLLLGVCSVAGATLAIFIAVSIPPFWLKLYIGVLVFTMGLVILLFRRRNFPFRWRRMAFLGALAAFNKGMSGGGYGPVVTSGQILAGVSGRNAVGITSAAEGLTCLTGLIAYFFLASQPLDWSLARLLLIGTILSVPFAALSVRKMGSRKLTTVIAAATLVLGTATIFSALFH